MQTARIPALDGGLWLEMLSESSHKKSAGPAEGATLFFNVDELS
jgi:hypothetical protein